MEKYEEVFSEHPEYEPIYQRIKAMVTEGKSPVEHPTAIVLGGQPGSGKGNIYKFARERFSQNIVELDCDVFREFHPDAARLSLQPETYGYNTNEFTFSIVDRLEDELKDQKYNMIKESSLRTPDTAFLTHDKLVPLGYRVELQIMATQKHESWLGCESRFASQMFDYNEGLSTAPPRSVPQSFHDNVVANVADSLSTVYQSTDQRMDNILIFNRTGKCLYDMSKTPDIDPKGILQSEIHKENIPVRIYSLQDKGLAESGAADYSALIGMGKIVDRSIYGKPAVIGVTCYQKTDAQIIDMISSNAEMIKQKLGTDIGIGTVIIVRDNAYFVDSAGLKKIPDFEKGIAASPLHEAYSKDPLGTIHDLALRLDARINADDERLMTMLDTRSVDLEHYTEEAFYITAKTQSDQVNGILSSEPAAMIVNTDVVELRDHIFKAKPLSEADSIIEQVQKAYDTASGGGSRIPTYIDVDTFWRDPKGTLTKIGIRMDLNEGAGNVSEKLRSVLRDAISRETIPARKQLLSEISKGVSERKLSPAKGVQL